MDRDREANTRCTWFTQIGYVHGVEEFSLIVKGLHKYIGSSSPFLLMMAWLSSTIWVCEWKEGDRQCLGVKVGWGVAVVVDKGLDFFFLEKRDLNLNLKIGGILWVFEFEN
ncbi:hypothetical protein DVH24_017496 [Malus domestica]|uniref:Uncharacterized protein n=1 Tax=Malus domestica TaxID=3750 RepID=A0A498IY95_MALDO|nr:hypothetical protein DVH24_017496 [Malus domestica]